MDYRKYKKQHREKKRRSLLSDGVTRKLKITVLALGVGGSLWLAGATTNVWRMESALSERGLTARGSVTTRQVTWTTTSRVQPPLTIVRVVYLFHDQKNQPMIGSQWVPPLIGDNLPPGRGVDVLYLPESPDFNRLAESPRTNVLLGFLFSFFVGGLCAWGLIGIWRER